MRNLVLRNMTSLEKRRRILSSQEISERDGIRTFIRRNFIFQATETDIQEESPDRTKVYILKYHNSDEQKDKFLFRLKGSIYAVSNDKVYLITYIHSFKLELKAM